MIDFSKVDVPNKIDKTYVLNKLNEGMIFAYYHGPFEIGKVYPSKFRKDVHPSCGFYVSRKTEKLFYNDISRREKLDCFDFVQKLYGLSNFQDVIDRIAIDFGLMDGKPKKNAAKAMRQLKDFDNTVKKEIKIHFSVGKWDDEHLGFWEQYHITKKELQENHIYPVGEKLYVNERRIFNHNNALRFALTTEVDGDLRTKLYTPYSSEFKWVTNIPNAHPFGLESLKKQHPFVFVAKSQKCRIVLKKFLPEVIAIQSEAPSALSDTLVSKLLFDYEKLYLGADNDEAGMGFMKEMEPKGCIPLHLPEEWLKHGVKDFSDLAKKKGLKAVEKFLKQKKLI